MKRRGSTIAGVMLTLILMCRTDTAFAAESAQVPLEAEAEITATYTVKADPYLELIWNSSRKDYEGTYRIGVRGKIADNKAIRIAPDATFQMSSGKRTHTGTVKQEFTRWAMSADRADTLILSEDRYVTTTGTAAIKLSGTGVYHGGIQFTFSIE